MQFVAQCYYVSGNVFSGKNGKKYCRITFCPIKSDGGNDDPVTLFCQNIVDVSQFKFGDLLNFDFDVRFYRGGNQINIILIDVSHDLII